MNKLQDIIEEIKKLEKELFLEIQKKEEEFFYKIKGKRVYFEEETKKYHKTLVTKVNTYILNHDEVIAIHSKTGLVSPNDLHKCSI